MYQKFIHSTEKIGIKRILAIILTACAVLSSMVFSVGASPADYYQIQNQIVLPSGGYNVTTSHIGLKTIYVNKALLGNTNDRYSSQTMTAVKNFQKRKGLKVTGIVDCSTWTAMGYSVDDWNNLGTYRTPMKISPISSRNDCMNAMIKTATEYLGTAYKIGCSGKPGSYVDCSGLIYQCLYSIGINPKSNIVDHALAVNEYASRTLAADPKLGKSVSVSAIQAGDLLFYENKQYPGSVCHVALYIGSGKIIDAWPTIGVTKRSMNISGYPIIKAVRVLPEGNSNDLSQFPPNFITSTNSHRNSNELSLYNKSGKKTGTNQWGTEILVDSSGKVIDVQKNIGSATVPNGGFILSGHGTKAVWLNNNIYKGMRVWILNNYVYFSEYGHNVITGKNCGRDANALVIYDTAGKSTGANQWGTEVAVNANNVVTEVRICGKAMTVPPGGYVLSGHGISAAWLNNNVKAGYKIEGSKAFATKITARKLYNGEFWGINTERYANSLVVYNGKKSTGANQYGTEVVVDANGKVCDIQIYKGNAEIPTGGFAVSGHGTSATWLANNFSIGKRVWTDGGIVFQMDYAANIVTGRNCGRNPNALILFDNAGKSTGTNKWGTEVAVNSLGVITEIRYNGEPMTVQAGGYVLSGHGISCSWLISNLHVGQKITEKPSLKEKIVSHERDTNELYGINSPREANALIMFNKSLTKTGTNMWGIEAFIDSAGIVTDIEVYKGNATVPEGGFILSGHGTMATWILDNIKIGDMVSVNDNHVEVINPQPE